MKPFFLQTYLFWIITRLLFITVIIFDAFLEFSKATNALNVLIYVGVLGYIGLMIYNTVSEFQNKTTSPVPKYIVGTISILIGILFFLLLMSYGEFNLLLVLFLVAWIILLGAFDLTIMNRQEEEADSL